MPITVRVGLTEAIDAGVVSRLGLRVWGEGFGKNVGCHYHSGVNR